jgi:hypothetical protein
MARLGEALTDGSPWYGRGMRWVGANLFGCLLVALGVGGCNASISVADSCSLAALGCPNAGTGYVCSGSAAPSSSGQVCNPDGGGDFCCYPTTCGIDPGVDCGSATGYSCAAGDDPPDQTDFSLVCSVPTASGSEDLYCCYENTDTNTGTCSSDSSVQGCQPDSSGVPSYGFSCTGPDTPTSDYSSLDQCSDPTEGVDGAGNAALLFCCTFE